MSCDCKCATTSWVGLQSVIVVYPDHTNFCHVRSMCNILSCVPVFLNYSPLVETDETIYNNTFPKVQMLIAGFRPSTLPSPTPPIVKVSNAKMVLINWIPVS